MDIATIVATLKLVDFGLDKLKGSLSKRQRKQVVQQAEKLIHIATEGEIDTYVAEPRRKTIDYVTRVAGRATKQKGRTAAQRKAQTLKMKQYWAKRKKQQRKK